MRMRLTLRVAPSLLAMLVVLSASAIALAPAPKQPIAPWLSLYGVAVNGEGRCYAVGGKGSLLESADNGKTWSLLIMQQRPGAELFQDRDFYSIEFAPDGKSGWIVGEKGMIFHTEDGGANWARQDSGVEVNLLRVAATDAHHAYAAGDDGTLLRTEDGKSWIRQQLNHITYFDLAFTDANTGWAVGEFSTVLGTNDGGKTWQLRYGGNLSDYEAGPYVSVIFSDHDHGFVMGLHGDLVVTGDGGKTWQRQRLPEPKTMYAGAVAPDGTVWLGGEDGQFFDSSKADHWSAHRVVFNDLTDLAFTPRVGLAVGLNGTLLRTDNGGREWHPVR